MLPNPIKLRASLANRRDFVAVLKAVKAVQVWLNKSVVSSSLQPNGFSASESEATVGIHPEILGHKTDCTHISLIDEVMMRSNSR